MTAQKQSVLSESEMPPVDADYPEFIIKPAKGWRGIDVKELWLYRELFYFFVWRDIKVKYKQTILGAAWAIIVPFMDMIVFSLFFGYLANMPSDGVPYPVWNFTAQVPWRFFANGMSQASSSLVSGANIIKKIYFPRIVMPTAAVVAGIVDFALAFVVLLLVMLYFGYWPTLKIFWVVVYLFITIMTSLGAGLWFAAMNVQFRDVRYTLPFIERMWFFITPIAYPTTLIPEALLPLYYINPMVSVVDGFRWALLGTDTRPGVYVIVSLIGAAILLVTGMFYFQRMEKSFADVA